jgi:hypothetical protein
MDFRLLQNLVVIALEILRVQDPSVPLEENADEERFARSIHCRQYSRELAFLLSALFSGTPQRRSTLKNSSSSCSTRASPENDRDQMVPLRVHVADG